MEDTNKKSVNEVKEIKKPVDEGVSDDPFFNQMFFD